MKWFGRLQEAMQQADPKLVRRFLTEAIERVDIRFRKERWTARRFKYFLGGGTIEFKTNNLSTLAR